MTAIYEKGLLQKHCPVFPSFSSSFASGSFLFGFGRPTVDIINLVLCSFIKRDMKCHCFFNTIESTTWEIWNHDTRNNYETKTICFDGKKKKDQSGCHSINICFPAPVSSWQMNMRSVYTSNETIYFGFFILFQTTSMIDETDHILTLCCKPVYSTKHVNCQEKKKKTLET